MSGVSPTSGERNPKLFSMRTAEPQISDRVVRQSSQWESSVQPRGLQDILLILRSAFPPCALITMQSALVLLAVLSSAAGDYRAVCPEPIIEAVEGDSVLLRCRLDPLINLSTLTVDWKRLKEVVHAYRHGKDQPGAQLPEYRGRTTLSHEDLNGGDVNLEISSLNQSDAGSYKCYVPKLKANCTVDLNVVKKDQQSRTKTGDFSTSAPPVEEVTCPHDGDAAKMEAVSPGVVGGVAGGILVAVAVAAVVIVILVKRGKIRVCVRGQRGETAASNTEMAKLRT
ncbi:uncharacterized protein ABDE67_019903 [Symphorus nematophorus]